MAAVGSLSGVPVRPSLRKRERPALRPTSASGGAKSATFGYDGNGNMTSVSGTLFGDWALVYDDEDRPTSITHPNGTDTYLWNALGQRMEASLHNYGTRRYVYHGDRVLEETNVWGTAIARYTTESGSYYDALQHFWRINAGGQSRFPLYDAVGSARGLVDENATVTDTYTLDSFGHWRYPGYRATTVNFHRYGGAWGYITDHSSGLLQLGARFYWPELGRFIQQDPIGDDINWYAYAANNPTVYADPEGNAPRRTSDEMIADATANLQRCLADAAADLSRCLSETGILDYAAGAAGGALLVDAAWTHLVKLHPYAKIAAGIYGAARGIGAIGAKAVESIARQPEARPGIFTSMIITAALIEGFTFFALVVIIIANGKL